MLDRNVKDKLKQLMDLCLLVYFSLERNLIASRTIFMLLERIFNFIPPILFKIEEVRQITPTDSF